ncbi:hypothetical protein WN48_02987, partial [Eufriesea mexicana]
RDIDIAEYLPRAHRGDDPIGTTRSGKVAKTFASEVNLREVPKVSRVVDIGGRSKCLSGNPGKQ